MNLKEISISYYPSMVIKMKHTHFPSTLLFLLCFSICRAQDGGKTEISTGVSLSLAQYRKEVISELAYTIHFSIPQNKADDIFAKEKISFHYKGKNDQPLLVDFKENPDKINSISVNGKNARWSFLNEHLVFDAKSFARGGNKIEIDFVAGNGALNRREDLLYTLFVPDRARTVFPLFDQPDLKAIFHLTLTIPKDWKGIANGKLFESTVKGDQKTLHFTPTELLPSYLFSFAAGDFNVATERWRDQGIELLYRETDSAKINASIPDIFKEYKKYITFYENWTGIRYPFQKYGMVAIPDFQFGGMEHPGAILFQSSTLFLSPRATQKELNSRSNLLAHEVAHMWFGDLVTMRWFNDVWTKEVFANFMADKATADTGKQEDFDLKFLTTHFPAAYSVDRTLGANPIRQTLHNLEDAGTMYGEIIYDKAPIMMQQLEKLMGDKAFQNGIKTYLKTYAFNNATWPDLVEILSKNTSENVRAWNQVWVNQPGRPLFSAKATITANKINQFQLTQKPEFGEGKFWPQSFDITFYDHQKPEVFEIKNHAKSQQISQVMGQATPQYIQYNALGKGYGIWPVDSNLVKSLYVIKNPVSRASAYINLYENMLNGKTATPLQVLNLFASGLKQETTELNLQLLTGYITNIYWEYLAPAMRRSKSDELEKIIWNALMQQQLPNNKKILFKAYENIFQSTDAGERLFAIWKNQTPPDGVTLTEDDYTNLALDLELRKQYPNLLNDQLARIKNPDRRKRFEIIAPALSFDSATRASFFKSITQAEGRRNESAVLAAISYFHHPLRQPSAEKYLMKTLKLLPEVQKTNDIFFPGRWLQSTFAYYQSKEAYEIVEQFLKENPGLNPKLKEKVLQRTDPLRRAQKIIGD